MGLLIGGTAFWTIWQITFWLVAFDVDRHPWFVVLIDMDQTFAQSIGYLVIMWAVVEMAPEGIEGTTLALATTVGNAGQGMGGYIVVAFNAMFALDQQQLEGDSDATRRQYWYNSIAVVVMQWLYLLLLCWMPSGFSQSKERFQKEAATKSKVWGGVALFFVGFAVVWGTLSTLMTFMCPCNVIFGGPGCEPHLFSCANNPVDHSLDGKLHCQAFRNSRHSQEASVLRQPFREDLCRQSLSLPDQSCLGDVSCVYFFPFIRVV